MTASRRPTTALSQGARPYSAMSNSKQSDGKGAVKPDRGLVRTYSPPAQVLADRSQGYAIVARPLRWMPKPLPARRPRTAVERHVEDLKAISPPPPPPVEAPAREPHRLFWQHRDDFRWIFSQGMAVGKEVQGLLRGVLLLMVPPTTPAVQLTWAALLQNEAQLGGAHGLLASWRTTEDEIWERGGNPRSAQRCCRFLERFGLLPDSFHGHAFCFSKALCRWTWQLCHDIFTSKWLHPKQKKWVHEECIEELEWAVQYGVSSDLQADVAQAWEEMKQGANDTVGHIQPTR